MASGSLRPGGTYSMNTTDPSMQFQIQLNGVTGGDKMKFDHTTIKIYELSAFGTPREIKLSDLTDTDANAIRKALTNSVLTNGTAKLTKPEMATALELFNRQLQLSKPKQEQVDVLKGSKPSGSGTGQPTKDDRVNVLK